MSAPRARLLCTGDLHVGRFPSYLPPDDRTLSVEAAWERTVERALLEEVDAVVLTGDVADQDNKLFEAFGPLQKGVERLAAAGIRTVAVAGNHDYDALRRLAALLDAAAFTLLGRDGGWTSILLERDGAPALRLVGWSFPDRYVQTSPLVDFPDPEDDLPTLGVLHADLDQPTSPYAPVALSDLVAAPVAGWLLGHVHRPSLRMEEGTCVLYPGSLQPLDPGEPGPHGPWIVTVDAGGAVSAEHRPLANVRYDEVVVDLSAVADREGAEAAVVERATNHLTDALEEQPDAYHHVLDLRLQGRTPLHGTLANLAADLEGQELPGGQATGFVRRVTVATRPAYDLQDVARRNDPAGAVAQLVLDVEADAEGARALVAEAAHTIGAVDSAPAYAPLRRSERDRPPPDDEARTLLVEQGLRLLDRLLQQHEAHDAA